MIATDPITIEVVRSSFISIIREMRASITRAAFSPIVYEMHDFSCALLDSNAEILALSEDLPAHILPTALAVQMAQERFGESIYPGDVIMVNEPYVLGSHMNDTATLHPYFIDDELALWVSVRVHYLDIGGMSPGSIAIQATDVHQEGIRIPPIKIYNQGEPNHAALDLLLANVRESKEFEGDLIAVTGAATTAHARLDEVIAKYGESTVKQCAEVILDRGEQRMRDAIGRMEVGEYYHEQYMESPNDGKPLLISVRLTVNEDGRVVVDFSGSIPQTASAINGGTASAPCGAFIALKAALDPDSPVNAGAFRPIDVITQEGSILRAKYPAACCGAMNVINATTEAVMKTLAPAYPDGVVADAVPIYAMNVLSGWDEKRQRRYIHFESGIGGTGGVEEHDGNNVLAGYERSDFGRIMPAESTETTFPLRVERTELVADSGGAGRNRGGLGLRRHFRVLSETASLTSNTEPSVYPTSGLFSGSSGGSTYQATVIRDNERLVPGPVNGKTVGFPLKRDDLIELVTSTGAGYGDPLEREPALVLRDIINGYVTEAHAKAAYGVVLHQGSVDLEATAILRRQLAEQRRYLIVEKTAEDLFESGRRVGPVSIGLASSLGLQDGDIIEYVSKKAAALRAWVKLDTETPEDRISLGPLGCLALRVEAGELIWVRPLLNMV